MHAQPSWHSVPLTTHSGVELFCWAVHADPLLCKISFLLSQTDTKKIAYSIAPRATTPVIIKNCVYLVVPARKQNLSHKI